MKKKFIYGFVFIAISAVAAWNVNFNSQTNGMSDVALANVEALAGENDALPYESVGCQTESCKLDLGGGWFTGSVKRVCIILDNGQYSSCISKACGEVFYGGCN